MFERAGWSAIVGPGGRFELEGDLRATVVWRATDRSVPSRIIDPASVAEEARGEGTTARRVRTYVAEGELIVGETLNPPGGWSSYPPHRHEHEELYLYRFEPPIGFGVHVSYDDAADAARVVRDGSIERITDGYHPVVAAPAAAMYYLWALAGDTDTVDTQVDPLFAGAGIAGGRSQRFLDARVRLPRESWPGCFPGGRMTTTDLPATMPAAVLKGLRHVEVEDRPLPTLGPREVLLEISHCGICGSDLHFMVEWEGAAKPGAIEGHEYSGTVVALGSRRRGLEHRRRGRRRAVAPLRRLRVLPRRAAVAVPRAGQGRRGRQRVAGSVRAVQGGERGRDAARARRALVAPRRAGRADGRRVARHHPLGRRRMRATS